MTTTRAARTERPPAHIDLVCARDGRTHVVDPAAYAQALVDATRETPAWCGHVVLMDALGAGGPRCRSCSSAREARRARPGRSIARSFLNWIRRYVRRLA